MQIKTLNHLLLSISCFAAASNAHAGVLTASPQAGATSFAAPDMMILSANAVSMLHGAGSYLDSFSILTAYQNVSGGGLMVTAAIDPWDFGLPSAAAEPVADMPAPAFLPLPLPLPLPPAPADVCNAPAAPAAPAPEFPAPVEPAAPGPADMAPPASPPAIITPAPADLAPIAPPVLDVTPDAPAVDLPEPASFGLFCLGLAGLLMARRRRAS